MESQANGRAYAIDVDKAWHVAWWAEKLEVSIQTLMHAVSLVGNDSVTVQRWLQLHRDTNSTIDQLAQATPPSASVDGRPDA